MKSVEDAYQWMGFSQFVYILRESVYESVADWFLPSLYTSWGRVSMKSVEDAYQWMGFP